ncbi:unnamed protein product [Phytophthora lilii]|uniref:Unnamed protein product n=1 Tax=Phytophthora lilii TaxID=2077276 RepID=A0A9W6X9B3_9STRA|nr:unnamed protein product [Phytophthora lilii]
MTGSTTTIMPHLQSLSPVTITPTRSSKSSAPLSFLEKIDRVEINHTTERGGVIYYVLVVFLEHSTSRIPTNKTAFKPSSNDRPDYQLERRFNDFANLRNQVWAYAQHKHQDGCACKYCDAFMSYIVHSMSQPRLFVKLATGVDTRKKLMATFCNEFISMTLGGKTEPRPRNIACDGFQAIPYVMERFFRKEEA